MGFPKVRMRRLRRTPLLRQMVQETRLDASSLILPLFVRPGRRVRTPIATMPGNHQLSVDELVEECRRIMQAGIGSVLLFGIPAHKDPEGRIGYSKTGIVQQAVRAVKKALPDLCVITDVCNCEYTSHGHCGVIVDGDVHNDKTLAILAKQALSHADAGCDMVAPSDMMDGRVGRIRGILDDNGHSDLPIMSYAAKFASAFYGPFRDAAESAPKFGDRCSYQMNPANAGEALREVALDIEEGADIVMIKPALSYLDIIYRVRQEFNVPVAAYNVSGEFSMVKAAAARNWIDEDRVMMEILLSIKRAGAGIIITYHAARAAKLLAKGWC